MLDEVHEYVLQDTNIH